MSNPVFFAGAAAAAAAVILLALVFPQGLGARSPGPFGHPPAEIKPAAPASQPALRPSL